MSEFKKDLERLINSHCKENVSNTPDFILAMFLNDCLTAFNTATQGRDMWYKFKYVV